jgi:lysozyme family protein
VDGSTVSGGASDFDIAVNLILGYEGAVSDHPDDAGGLTRFGLASRWFPEVRRADFTREDAIAIYKRDFWNACACGLMPSWLALLVFDAAVQHAPGDAILMLQRALGVVADGYIGDQTLLAARQAQPGHLGALIDQRMQKYLAQSKAEWASFGRGWMRRLMSVTRECLVRLQAELA